MKLKEYIKNHSARELAKKAGITVNALYNYTGGAREPTPAIARAIVSSTNGKVSFKDLYGDDGK